MLYGQQVAAAEMLYELSLLQVEGKGRNIAGVKDIGVAAGSGRSLKAKAKPEASLAEGAVIEAPGLLRKLLNILKAVCVGGIGKIEALQKRRRRLLCMQRREGQAKDYPAT